MFKWVEIFKKGKKQSSKFLLDGTSDKKTNLKYMSISTNMI